MDPLDFLGPEELLRFFHCKKTIMSCMENLHTFLSQLRDHDLIPDDRYKKLSHMRSRENLKRGVYEFLDWLERERPKHIVRFWRCVFEEAIMDQYPTLRLLRNSLEDGSFHFYTHLPEKMESEENDKSQKKQIPEEEEEKEEEEKEKHPNPAKKRKLRSRSLLSEDGDGEEQPGPSSQLSQVHKKKKSKKISFSSPKKGERGEMWTWAIYKALLPVTCGDLEASLNRNRLAKGEKCVLFQKRWLTPSEFQELGGNKSSKNWRQSIRCDGTPLGKLLQEGHLKSVEDKDPTKAKKNLFTSNQPITVSDGEEGGDESEDEGGDEEALSSSTSRQGSPEDTAAGDKMEEQAEQQQQEADLDGTKVVFKVTCGAATATLHKKRFASGGRGNSIRTEQKWMSPEEFVKEASSQTDASWEKEIRCEGEPLEVLIQSKVLEIHEPQCSCRLCQPDQKELENQKNDDECFVCKSETGPELVECDGCPRSFHRGCHLPHVEDAILRDNRRWMCTFCVLKANQQWRYSDDLDLDLVLTHPVSRHLLECQYLYLCLCGADEEQDFAVDPNLYVKKYSTRIRTPMWFELIGNKLQNREYRTVAEFVSDVRLVFSNCATFNKKTTKVFVKGSRLKKLFEAELKEVFS